MASEPDFCGSPAFNPIKLLTCVMMKLPLGAVDKVSSLTLPINSWIADDRRAGQRWHETKYKSALIKKPSIDQIQPRHLIHICTESQQ